ncbi:sulfite reductase subunit alpha [Roseimaritima ulvae]|nr:sulfite reductase subunit alpha [Roseimaritima ulvae]
MSVTLIPESAPFSEEQRAWLNGFFAGLMGIEGASADAALQQASAAGLLPEQQTAEEEETFPWHDDSLPIVDRMELADGKPLERRLMAAMAQLDCGSCGYVCQTYAEALARGEESSLALCSPGGKETKKMLKTLLAEEQAEAGSNGASSNGAGQGGAPATKSNGTAAAWSRQNPFPATLLESRPLNQEGSAKDTRHVAIDLSGSGLSYQVGDALGIYPVNCGELAELIVEQLSADANVNVRTPLGNEKPLLTALQEDCCLKDPSDELIELLIERIDDLVAKTDLQTMLREGVPEGVDVLDILQLAGPATVSATEVMETMEGLIPRLYSIASSMQQVGQQVHLTVGKVTFERNGRLRKGTASTMLAERVAPGEKLRVFVQPQHGGFTVPADPNTPMIMVGPGTGIAPFIAFLQERVATKASGKNWLFFGDQHEACDFLYQQELQAYQSLGALERVSTAFSRDGSQKIYVQDRMHQLADELWQWINAGAHFYVCGDASRMAVDVDRALKQIIARESGMSENETRQYVDQMIAEKRYVRDVY